jgi:hypothetical protein
VPIFYVKMEHNGKQLKVGAACLQITRSHKYNPALVGTIYIKNPKVKVLKQILFLNDADGFCFWGSPNHRLQRGLTIPRIATINQNYRSVVVWLDSKGNKVGDVCDYSVINGPRDRFSLSYRFRSGEEIDIVFSLAKHLPLGVDFIQ